jgi:hypothetical protein
MRHLLREPLLHFLLLGAAIFAAFHWMSGPATRPDAIVVTQGRIEALAAAFARAWQRPPTEEELDGLIRDYIREEVAVREAISLGLDEDDTIIRRRLRQKLEFVSDDLAAQAEPTDEELNAYLTAHPDAFRTEPRFTFTQIYLNPERRGDSLARDAAQLVAQLQRGAPDVAALGDPFLLEPRFEALRESEVRSQFGETFASALSTLEPGRWQGPVASGYGAHLVLVTERTEGGIPQLAEVRDAVRREWTHTKRVEATELFYRTLLQRYTVTIEQSQPRGGEKLAGVRR